MLFKPVSAAGGLVGAGAGICGGCDCNDSGSGGGAPNIGGICGTVPNDGILAPPPAKLDTAARTLGGNEIPCGGEYAVLFCCETADNADRTCGTD
jgi:hypothetical protein